MNKENTSQMQKTSQVWGYYAPAHNLKAEAAIGKAFVDQAKRGFPIVDEYVTKGVMTVPGAIMGGALGAYQNSQAHGWDAFTDKGKFKDSIKNIYTGVAEGAKAGWREAAYADSRLNQRLANVANELVPGTVGMFSENAAQKVRDVQNKTPVGAWKDFADRRVAQESPGMMDRNNPTAEDIATGENIGSAGESLVRLGAELAAYSGLGKGLKYMSSGKNVPAAVKTTVNAVGNSLPYAPVASEVLKGAKSVYDAKLEGRELDAQLQRKKEIDNLKPVANPADWAKWVLPAGGGLLASTVAALLLRSGDKKRIKAKDGAWSKLLKALLAVGAGAAGVYGGYKANQYIQKALGK